MGDSVVVTTAQNNSQNSAFADAVQRAREVNICLKSVSAKIRQVPVLKPHSVRRNKSSRRCEQF